MSANIINPEGPKVFKRKQYKKYSIRILDCGVLMEVVRVRKLHDYLDMWIILQVFVLS
jgi:hypothetical protein